MGRLRAKSILIMRAFDGQKSDNRPVNRSAAEKRKQLAELKLRLAAMRSYESQTLREAMKNKIAELEAELSGAPRVS
jgi:hypothetical protein